MLLRIFLGLLALLVAAWLFEDIRGRLAWKSFRRAAEAKGERFDVAGIIPKPVPPEQNFATTPFFAPFLDYQPAPKGSGKSRLWADEHAFESNKVFARLPERTSPKGANLPKARSWEKGEFTELEKWQAYFQGSTNFPFAVTLGEPAEDFLKALGKFDALLAELNAASARPHSVFPVHYDELFTALLPHLATLKSLSTIVQLRAVARLEAGQAAPALDDARLGLRLADTLKSEPLLISQLVRMAMIQIAMQPVWEGLARRRWSEEQVAALQETLQRIDVLEAYPRAMRGERTLSLHAIELVRTGKLKLDEVADADSGNAVSPAGRPLSLLIPGGFFRQNQVRLCRLFEDRCIPLVDVEQHRVHATRTEKADDVPELKGFKPYSLFAKLLFPAVSKSAVRFARTQTTLDLALVACALERHRLATGKYPESLAALTPRLLAMIPPDVISGEPLHYERKDAGTFVLYSVGWNETDEGGEVSTNRSGVVEPKKGDWAWSYPAPVQGK